MYRFQVGTSNLKNGYQTRLIFITHDFPPIVSGISTVFYNLLKRVDNREILLIAPKVEGWEEIDRTLPHTVKRVWIPLGNSLMSKIGKTVLSTLYLIYYLLSFRAGSIHCGQILSNGLGGLFCRWFLSIPYTLWVYGSETVRLGRGRAGAFLLKVILKRAHLVVVNSEFTREEYIRFGVDRAKLVKISPGVDTSRFKPMEQDKALVKTLGLEGRKVILTVGRLDERKGHDKVIEALLRVKDSFPEALYLVVGVGREEERLKAMVKRSGLEDSVIFAGYIPDDRLPLYYNLCDVFCLPNRVTERSALKGDYEGFGIVFIEASACGKPVIGGRNSGVEDAVVHGVTGLLVDPLSVEEIAGAIERLLRDRDLAEKMGRAGRERAVREFEWEVVSRRFKGIL